MNNLLEQSTCKGIRPSFLSAYPCMPRRMLVGKLLGARASVRVLSAPAGFGKTYLADEYAQSLFSYWHVTWVDCEDVRFSQQLDTLDAACVLRADEQTALVVFDDVPLMSLAQQQRFAATLEDLVARSIEVLVCATPLTSAFLALLVDPFVLATRSLLVRDAEREQSPSGGRTVYAALHMGESFMRIPALVWGDSPGLGALLQGLARDCFPESGLLAATCLFALGSASAQEVSAVVGVPCETYLDALVDEYAMAGFDDERSVYLAPACSQEMFESVVVPVCNDSLLNWEDAKRAEFVTRFLDTLEQRGMLGAACCAARMMLPYSPRRTWLLEHAGALVLAAELETGRALCASLCSYEPYGKATEIAALQLLFEALHGGAFDSHYALRMALDNQASRVTRSIAALLVLLRGSSAQQRDVRASLAELQGGLSSLTRENAYAALELSAAGQSSCAQCGSTGSLAVVTCSEETRMRATCASLDEIYLSALVALAASVSAGAARALESWDTLAVPSFAEQPEHPLVVIAALWLFEAGAFDRSCAATNAALTCLSHAALVKDPARRLLAQGAKHALDLLMQSDAQQQALRGCAPKCTDIPFLKVSLFGALHVQIDGRILDERSFHRRKAITLLALLAMEPGRDVARERLEESLWPESTAASARNNLYAVWSELRKGVSLPDGSCPYLRRVGDSFRLESRYVECDVDAFTRACDALFNDKLDTERIEQAYELLDACARGGFMPSERSNDKVIRFRDQCCVHAVDALVHASDTLLSRGECFFALRLARAAVSYDGNREDSYEALMRAQMAAGQRTSALATYFSCRSRLSEELGIDPSCSIIELYEAALDDKEPVSANMR